MLDLTIIGAGPAGLSAAIPAKRFDLNFTILEKTYPGGQALAANLIENYPGLSPISGRELMGRFIDHVASLGIEIFKNKAKKINKDGNIFHIETNKGPVKSKNVIVATGLVPKKIKREGVFYYPVPDDVPHESKNVLIIGGGDSAFDEAISFSKKARSVTIAMCSKEPKAIEKLIVQARKLGVIVKNGLDEDAVTAIKADVVIACVGKTPSDIHLLKEGVYLAGDIAHPNIRHVAVAVGDGITAIERIVRK